MANGAGTQHSIAAFLTGEWLLTNNPNGGHVIAARSVIVALEIYVAAVLLRSWASASWAFNPDLGQAGKEISETLPWFGAILAAVYAALYARFAAQWSYLANLYNQIMVAIVQCPDDKVLNANEGEEPTPTDHWMAAFVEDAMTLHLARKTLFAELVWHLLDGCPGVRKSFDDSVTAGGKAAREKLEHELQARFPGLEYSGCTGDDEEGPRTKVGETTS